jgi:hypothetical protein
MLKPVICMTLIGGYCCLILKVRVLSSPINQVVSVKGGTLFLWGWYDDRVMKNSIVVIGVVGAIWFSVLQIGLADPGTLFAERKAALVAKFDANGDGRLDAEERLAMRADRLKPNNKGGSRGRGGFMPPVLLEAFDENKNGEIDGNEGDEMDREMQRRFQKLVQTYDQNGDGELNQKEEIMALQKAVKDGGHDALDTMLAGFLFGRMGSQEDGKDNGKPNWKSYDRNNNGIAEADELEAMRAQGSK